MRYRWLLLATCIVTISWPAAMAQEEVPDFPRIPSGAQIEALSGDLPGAADNDSVVRPIVRIALDLIKAFEGWAKKHYNDPAGYCTIGYGHLIALEKCSDKNLGEYAEELTREEGDKLLADDTRAARRAVGRFVKVQLNDRQFGALTSFTFNVGAGALGKSTLLKLLNQGEYEKAARELRKWVRAGKEILPGLVVRRNCEIALFKGATISRLKGGAVDTKACGAEIGAAPPVDETIDILTGESG